MDDDDDDDERDGGTGSRSQSDRTEEKIICTLFVADTAGCCMAEYLKYRD